MPPRTQTRNPYLPLQSATYQKINTPPPPLYPPGVCLQPSAAMPMVQNQQLTEHAIVPASKKWPLFGRFSVQFRRHFAQSWAPLAGLRRSVRGGRTPARSIVFTRRQGEKQRGLGLNYP